MSKPKKEPAPIEEEPAVEQDEAAAQAETAEAPTEAPPETEEAPSEEAPPEDAHPEEAHPEAEDAVQALDPTAVRIETKALTVDLLAQRMAEDAIDLAGSGEPGTPWDTVAQSRLVESLLLRVPLPAFYFDASTPERWLVVDGRGRLAALHAYINGGGLALAELEFLDHLEGKAFEALPRHFQRRILETKVTGHLIQEGTPEPVRDAIVRRLKAGG